MGTKEHRKRIINCEQKQKKIHKIKFRKSKTYSALDRFFYRQNVIWGEKKCPLYRVSALWLSALYRISCENLTRKNSVPKKCVCLIEVSALERFHYLRAVTSFSRFLAFSRKFMPLQISKQQNAKVFSREIIDNFENAKVFSRKNCFSKQIYEREFSLSLSEICCFQKIVIHGMNIFNIKAIFFIFPSISL